MIEYICIKISQGQISKYVTTGYVIHILYALCIFNKDGKILSTLGKVLVLTTCLSSGKEYCIRVHPTF